MLTLTVKIRGYRQGDLEIALEEVTRLVAAGNLGGMNSNATGEFAFDIEGEEADRTDCSSCRFHQHNTLGQCFCEQMMHEHSTCCEELMGSDHIDDAAENCPSFTDAEDADND